KRQEYETALICKSIHLQARALRNKNVDAVLEVEARGGGFEEILPLITGDRISKAWETGDVDLAPMMVGQSVGLVHDIPTVKELLARTVREAVDQVRAVSAKINA
ncbi:MAG TPA: nitronate monooxygenase, partial [Deltaproteobacteria bacterium]|nr:nitronate monooxygenase [Deltaproteobacteria bacterium]